MYIKLNLHKKNVLNYNKLPLIFLFSFWFITCHFSRIRAFSLCRTDDIKQCEFMIYEQQENSRDSSFVHGDHTVSHRNSLLFVLLESLLPNLDRFWFLLMRMSPVETHLTHFDFLSFESRSEWIWLRDLWAFRVCARTIQASSGNVTRDTPEVSWFYTLYILYMILWFYDFIVSS